MLKLISFENVKFVLKVFILISNNLLQTGGQQQLGLLQSATLLYDKFKISSILLMRVIIIQKLFGLGKNYIRNQFNRENNFCNDFKI